MPLIEGIGAVGQGLSKEIPNLLTAARDQRNENERQRAIQSPANQYTQAVSAQALEDLKKGQEKFAIADIEKMHPLAPAMIADAKAKMEIMPGQTHVELREIKAGMQQKLTDDLFMETALKGIMSQKTNEVKNAETSLGVEQEKLNKLQEDPLGNKVKIEETQNKIQNYTQVLGQSKQQESGLDAQLDKILLRKAQAYRGKLTGDIAIAWDAVLEKNKADGKVGRNAIPTAKQVEQQKLDNKYQEKPAEWKTFIGEQPEMANKWGTQEGGDAFKAWRKKQTTDKQASTITGLDIPSMSQSIKNGESSLSDIKNTRGIAASNMVMADVRKEFPHFNFIYQEANKKFTQSATNSRILGAVDASLPRVQMLAEQAEKLGNTPIPAWNSVLKQLSVQTGDDKYTNFMSNRNAIVQEVNTALSGSSQSSDMRVQIELDNLREARSPKQLAGSIVNLREALLARRESSMQYIYPMEVVRGEMTKAQFDKNIAAKYRGKYNATQSQSVPKQSGTSSNPFDN